jgi:hypothetical protein
LGDLGVKHVRGKSEIVRTCQESARELANTRTSFGRFMVITTDDCVVIDSRAEYIDDESESSHVASCDLYEFIDGNIAAITSYTIQVEPSR